MSDRLPPPVARALDDWMSVHDEVAPGVVEGLYVVGSAALGDWRDTSDVDVVAFTAGPADDDDSVVLEAAHERIVAAGGPVIDGPYLSWADVTSAPISLHRPWTLDGVYRHDGGCFEINPVTWFTLARHGVAVRGPDPSELDIELDDIELRRWVAGNLATYWASVRDELSAGVDSDAAFEAAAIEWCGLGVARMAFTVENAAVASKSAAGEWAIARYPAHAGALRLALDSRAGRRHTADADEMRSVVTWMTAVIDTFA